jgi:hypothetical protein
VKGIERPKIMLRQQSIRERENVLRIESQQCDRAITTAVGIEAI